MLPASAQAPAAVILLIGGLLACFAGYRIFRVVLGIYGFILGALLASNVVGGEQSGTMMLAAAIGGGLVGALLLIAAYFVGVALIGAGFGAGLANLIGAGIGREPHILVVILLAMMASKGTSVLRSTYVIHRGYEDLAERLNELGANIVSFRDI